MVWTWVLGSLDCSRDSWFMDTGNAVCGPLVIGKKTSTEAVWWEKYRVKIVIPDYRLSESERDV